MATLPNAMLDMACRDHVDPGRAVLNEINAPIAAAEVLIAGAGMRNSLNTSLSALYPVSILAMLLATRRAGGAPSAATADDSDFSIGYFPFSLAPVAAWLMAAPDLHGLNCRSRANAKTLVKQLLLGERSQESAENTVFDNAPGSVPCRSGRGVSNHSCLAETDMASASEWRSQRWFWCFIQLACAFAAQAGAVDGNDDGNAEGRRQLWLMGGDGKAPAAKRKPPPAHLDGGGRPCRFQRQSRAILFPFPKKEGTTA